MQNGISMMFASSAAQLQQVLDELEEGCDEEQLKETSKIIHANIEVTGDLVQGNKSIMTNEKNQESKWKELLRTIFT